MMTKLHELIAIEGDRLETTKQIVNECFITFSKKTEHFRSEDKVLTMLDEERSSENTQVSNEVVTTVDEKLEHVWKSLCRSIDITAAKDMTNTLARADITIKGEVLVKDVPAIVLLSLETTLGKIRNLYNGIPTLDPSVDWEVDSGARTGIFKSNKVKTFKTEKKMEFITASEATKEHPAQVHGSNRDVVIGVYQTVKRSGMTTPRIKSERLDRIGILISAVKQARQRANGQEVKEINIGEVVLNFISG